MNTIQNFAFDENLVRVVVCADEPWFVGVDVCRALGISKPRTSLDLLDEDEKGAHSMGTLGGEQTMIIVSEPGVYRLVFRSRKPEAERFKRWLAHDVLPELRRAGLFAVTNPPDPPSDPAVEGLLHRLQVIREARILFGRERARSLWRTVGLPDVPPPPIGPAQQARICLRHLLDADTETGGPAIRDTLEAALDYDEMARATLICIGIRPDPDCDGFIVANTNSRLIAIFDGTDWANGRHMRTLRRLPGATAAGGQRYGGQPVRGTWLSADLLDDESSA